ncbi:hypothetical protein BHL62_07185 [Xanthomonas oryzae pv. oryzae]|nr:hypothetical protein BHL62_07185 [Xanthomonas oryzae pv. oryzae]
MLKTSALAPCGKPMLIWPSQTSARRHGFSEASYFYCVTKYESVGKVRPRNTGSVGGFWR